MSSVSTTTPSTIAVAPPTSARRRDVETPDRARRTSRRITRASSTTAASAGSTASARAGSPARSPSTSTSASPGRPLAGSRHSHSSAPSGSETAGDEGRRIAPSTADDSASTARRSSRTADSKSGSPLRTTAPNPTSETAPSSPSITESAVSPPCATPAPWSRDRRCLRAGRARSSSWGAATSADSLIRLRATRPDAGTPAQRVITMIRRPCSWSTSRSPGMAVMGWSSRTWHSASLSAPEPATHTFRTTTSPPPTGSAR